MRTVALLVALFVAARIAATTTITPFDRTDRLEFRHYRGGKTMTKVKREEKADFVSTWGFYGFKRINGHLTKFAVDLHVIKGEERIANHFNRPVVVQFENGRVRIFRDWRACLKWGVPKWGMPPEAAAGMSVPPRSRESLPRQFIATKGDRWYHVRMIGTSNDCRRLAKRYGLTAMIHGDGDLSLMARCVHPSHLVVYRHHDTAVVLAAHQTKSRP